MDRSSKYFFHLITAFLKETAPPEPIDVDWRKIYVLSRIHFLSGAVYLSILKLDKSVYPDQNILKKFKSDFFNTLFRCEEQKKAYIEIEKKLNQSKIPHIFFKGAVISEYYPVKEMRTCGDIDILLHKEYRKSVDDALLEIEYKNIGKIGHWQYTKENILIEAHDKLMYSEINEKADYISYFENVWDNAALVDRSYRYELNIEYHLIFLMTHMAKHFYDNGCGVRMILDIAVIINKFGDSLDFVYFWREIKKLKLEVFAKNIFALCSRYFEVYIPNIGAEIDDMEFETISNYILEGGTFGFNNRNSAISIIRKQYDKTSNHKTAQFIAFWGKIFLNYKAMKKLYPILNKIPILLPFTWVIRIFQCIIVKPKKSFYILKTLISNPDKAEQSYEVMKKIGLS